MSLQHMQSTKTCRRDREAVTHDACARVGVAPRSSLRPVVRRDHRQGLPHAYAIPSVVQTLQAEGMLPGKRPAADHWLTIPLAGRGKYQRPTADETSKSGRCTGPSCRRDIGCPGHAASVLLNQYLWGAQGLLVSPNGRFMAFTLPFAGVPSRCEKRLTEEPLS